MSGGVDSSTVAAMLRAEGHNVIGLTMQLWNQRRLAGHEGMPESVQGRCCSLDDVYDARRVAETIGIPYYVVNHEERFERDVVRPFVEEYLSGRTPIPCSLCNNHLKFDQLLIAAQQIGADALATGHYARVEFDEARTLAAEASRRPRQGPDVLSVWTDPGAAQPHPVSAGRHDQARGARTGAHGTDWSWPRSRTRRRFALSPAATTRSFSMPIWRSRARRCPTPPASWSRPTAR